MVLLAPKRASDATLRRALEPLNGRVSIELMREANQRVDRDQDKVSPAQAAKWLAEKAGLD